MCWGSTAPTVEPAAAHASPNVPDDRSALGLYALPQLTVNSILQAVDVERKAVEVGKGRRTALDLSRAPGRAYGTDRGVLEGEGPVVWTGRDGTPALPPRPRRPQILRCAYGM